MNPDSLATISHEEIEKVLSRLADKAFTLTGRPVAKWAALDLIAHVEAGLFGYDPGCRGGCPLCR